MNYVYSTLTADHEFDSIVIYGRCGAKRRGKIDTPRGVATGVSDEQLEVLQKHDLFAFYVGKGHIVTQRRELPESKINKLVDNHMEANDASAQETKESLKKKTPAKKRD